AARRPRVTARLITNITLGPGTTIRAKVRAAKAARECGDTIPGSSGVPPGRHNQIASGHTPDRSGAVTGRPVAAALTPRPPARGARRRAACPPPRPGPRPALP